MRFHIADVPDLMEQVGDFDGYVNVFEEEEVTCIPYACYYSAILEEHEESADSYPEILDTRDIQDYEEDWMPAIALYTTTDCGVIEVIYIHQDSNKIKEVNAYFHEIKEVQPKGRVPFTEGQIVEIVGSTYGTNERTMSFVGCFGKVHLLSHNGEVYHILFTNDESAFFNHRDLKPVTEQPFRIGEEVEVISSTYTPTPESEDCIGKRGKALSSIELRNAVVVWPVQFSDTTFYFNIVDLQRVKK